MLVGYARVSTADQDPEYQLAALKERGWKRIFADRCSGRREHRPELGTAFDFLREGDSLVVWRLDRLGRSVRHLIGPVDRLGCQLVSLTERLDTRTPRGRVAFHVFAALAVFEADVNRERTREAARAARREGRTWGRRSQFHDPTKVEVAKGLLANPKLSKAEVARQLGIAKSTLYHWFLGGDPDRFGQGRNGKGRNGDRE